MSSQIQNKLLHYEVQPPPGVWDEILTELDNETNTVAEKLSQFEEIPNPRIWARIATRLDNTINQSAKLVPFVKRYRRPLKYTGAAAALILLAVLTSLLITNKSVSEIPSGTLVKNRNPVSTIDSVTPHQNTNEESTTTIAASFSNKIQKLITRSRKNPFVFAASQTYPVIKHDNFFPEIAHRNTSISYNSNMDNYLIYSNGDGQAVRLPKKLFDMFVCSSEDFVCKQKIKTLQQKIASSALNPDFTGVLEILNNLQENR